MQRQLKPSIPNVAILLLIIFFFPVGLLLLYIRELIDWKKPAAAMSNHFFSSKVLFVFFGIMSAIYFIQLAAGNEPLFSVYLVCIGVLLLPAILLRRRGKRLERELNMQAQHNGWDAHEPMRPSPEASFQHHQNGFSVPSARSDDTIRSNGAPSRSSQKEQVAEAARPQQALVPKPVTCSGCGARAMIAPHESKDCEYCGFGLSYPPA